MFDIICILDFSEGHDNPYDHPSINYDRKLD